MFEFVFLGTGAMKPTEHRFTSSLMVRYKGEVIMFDAGEGIQVRVAKSGFSPLKVNKIFITHFHGDHFYGLPGMIFTMAKSGRTEPLEVYVPRGSGRFVQEILSLGYGHIPFDVHVHELIPGDTVEAEYVIEAFATDHGPPSLGYVFREPDKKNVNTEKMKEHGFGPNPKFGRLKRGNEITLDGKTLKPEDWLIDIPGDSLAYTGDTRYNEAMVERVRGSTVLVHEATYAHADAESYDRGHSSAKEAAEIARAAGVKKLFLIHISPRYGRAKELEDEAKAIFPESEVPKDLDKYTVKRGELLK